ncbi:MAG: alpha/beta hydrolase-fold protein [Gemmatimonadales bacterium]|nr:alpha/beta hydrolase-fold protein [Gemmatimonadales bacterium]
MDVHIHGHAGARVLVFPTSKGWTREWEDQGMMRALADHLQHGWVQLWAVSSVDEESWYADWKRLPDRADWARRYDQYLYHELLPCMDHRNGNGFTIVAGASFGAFHALSFGLRHPDRVQRILALSGLCDIRRFTRGWLDATAYALNPWSFIPNEHDAARLALLRRQDIILATGRDDVLAGQNRAFSGMLWDKGIGNALRLWDGWSHDWPYWQRMLRLYLRGHD